MTETKQKINENGKLIFGCFREDDGRAINKHTKVRTYTDICQHLYESNEPNEDIKNAIKGITKSLVLNDALTRKDVKEIAKYVLKVVKK